MSARRRAARVAWTLALIFITSIVFEILQIAMPTGLHLGSFYTFDLNEWSWYVTGCIVGSRHL